MVSMEKLALAGLRPVYKTEEVKLVEEHVALVDKEEYGLALVHLSVVDHFITSDAHREKIRRKLEAVMKRLFEEGVISDKEYDPYFIEVSELQCIMNDDCDRGLIRLERDLRA